MNGWPQSPSHFFPKCLSTHSPTRTVWFRNEKLGTTSIKHWRKLLFNFSSFLESNLFLIGHQRIVLLAKKSLCTYIKIYLYYGNFWIFENYECCLSPDNSPFLFCNFSLGFPLIYSALRSFRDSYARAPTCHRRWTPPMMCNFQGNL